MAPLRASWREVTQKQGAPMARSSHAIAIVGSKAYAFGGEFEPRVPIDNEMHVFDIDMKNWSIAEAKGDIPKPRVGVTMASVEDIVYVFGGRDGNHEELNEFYSFDTKTGEWKLLSSGDKSPPHRSYHAMTADVLGKKIYTFGGCGKSGRCNDLWVFDIQEGKWSMLKSPPSGSKCIPRGGPGLVFIDGYVWVLFGFCGHELTDVHRYNLQSGEWEEVESAGAGGGAKPSGRSVFGSAVAGGGQYLVIYGGEVDPSDQGHMGAGSFSDQVFALDVKSLEWTQLGADIKEGTHPPGARGWFAAAATDNSILVYGGNSESNDRLDDMFLLTLEI